MISPTVVAIAFICSLSNAPGPPEPARTTRDRPAPLYVLGRVQEAGVTAQ